MGNSEFDDVDIPLQMEQLIEDAIEQILRDENPKRFIRWMSEHIQDYYTGPQDLQTGLFDPEPELPAPGPDQMVFTPEMAQVLSALFARSIWNGMPLPSNRFKQNQCRCPNETIPVFVAQAKSSKSAVAVRLLCQRLKLKSYGRWSIQNCLRAWLPKPYVATTSPSNHSIGSRWYL